MTSPLESEEQRIWNVPPNTRLNFKLSQELISRTWSYSIVDASFSDLSSSLPTGKSGDGFAPNLQTLKSRLDSALEQASALPGQQLACAGPKRNLVPTREDYRLHSFGAANSTKLKSSILRQRTFRTSTVRTSTQRRVRFLPETRVDEYVIESSSSQEESDELTLPLSKKSKSSFGGSDVSLASGAGRHVHPECTSVSGEEIISNPVEELSRTSSAFVTPNLDEDLACGIGVRTTELKVDSKSRPSDETRQENSCEAPNSSSTSASVTSCEAKAGESRYGTLPVNFKGPEHVRSVETANNRAERNADETTPVFGPTADHARAGPVCDPNGSEETNRTRGVSCCWPSPMPQEVSFFEDSLVQDSQEDYELEDVPVVHKTLEDAVFPEGFDNYHSSYFQQSVTAEGSCKLTGHNNIKSNSNMKISQYETRTQRGSLDANCNNDARLCRQEAAVVGCSVQTVGGGNVGGESMIRGEYGVRIPTKEKANACNLNRASRLSAPANTLLKEEFRSPGSAAKLNSKPAQGRDESGKCPVPNLPSHVFQTGRGSPIEISPSAMTRVMSLFNDDSAYPETRTDTFSPLKPMPRANPVVVSSALARAESCFSVRKNLHTHTLPAREPHCPESLNLDVSNGIAVEGNVACLFQTGRGEPVHISSNSMRRVQSIFATSEPSPAVEARRVPTSSNREAISLLKHKAPTKGRYILPVTGNEEFPNSGNEMTASRDSHEAGATSACASLSRSSLFRTGRDTPVSISSAALQKIRSIFDDDELQIEGENSKLESKQSPGEAVLCEPENYARNHWDNNLDRCQGLSDETRTSRDRSQSFAVEAGRARRIINDEGTEKATVHHTAGPRYSKVRKDSSPEASDWSFRGSSGRTLRVSSSAKAKAEALLRLGPEFVTPPKCEPRVFTSELIAKASESVAHLLVAEERRYFTCGVKEVDKEVNGDLGRKIPRIDSVVKPGTKPGFKSPRLIRPSSSSCDRQNCGSLQSIREPTTRRSYLLPVRLHYLHNKTSRIKKRRASMLQYFGGPPFSEPKTCSHSSREGLSVTADNAETFRIRDGLSGVGVEDIWKMLKDLGADQRYASQGWVANHFRWIVWKLASYERRFSDQHFRLLTSSSVINELKYRYDRELNGERSALKRVTERDASASHTMVLCVSAVRSVKDVDHFYETWTEKGDNPDGTKRKPPSAGVIEVTDGWYRLNAHIDVPLARRIHSGKLNIGQKIVVCGATLEGLSDGLPPLQAYDNAYLSINSNGVRRARWDERLGFCGTATPLAFKCIKQDGGIIPHTYVAITRRYPILYREKLAGGGYILRSDRAEDRAAHDFDQRRAKVAEEAMQKIEYCHSPTDEGAKFFAALETTADPESLLLDMTRAQLDAFAAFKARKETAAGDLIKTALESHGLATREVTPTFKVRVVGLNREGDKTSNKDGLVTIWQATEDMQEELQEGKVFCVYGLRPSAKGLYHSFNSTRWREVPRAALVNKFEFPYVPRAPLRISSLSDYMSSREFDVTGLVLFVTNPVTRDLFRGTAKSQWVFMTDGSCAKGDAADAWEETQVLAVEVSWPEGAFVPVESSLVGFVVGFCNLWLKHRDHSNRLWVAEASDRALYSTKMTSPAFRHLTSAAGEVQKWAKLNSWNVDLLQSDVEELAVHLTSTAILNKLQ